MRLDAPHRPRRRGLAVAPAPPPPGPAAGPPDCPGCDGGPIELVGFVLAPELVIGHCDGCGGLYMVEEDPDAPGSWSVLGRVGLMQPAAVRAG